jgi:uncharacterized repeat protein (TIGR01451 family)
VHETNYREYRWSTSATPEGCYTMADQEYITEPHLLSGREFRINMQGPVQGEDGKWRIIMPDTLLKGGQRSAIFPTHYTYRFTGWCENSAGGNMFIDEMDDISPGILYYMWSGITQTVGVDSSELSGQSQWYDSRVIDTNNNLLVRAFTGEVNMRRATCPAGAGPFEGSDPEVRALAIDVQELVPLTGEVSVDTAEMVAMVTCGEVPVRNAQVRVYLDVVAGSGGHYMTAGRPLGSIDDTKIVTTTQAVTLNTDANGNAFFTVRAGKDTRHQRIAISGAHAVRVESVRYPDVFAEQYVTFQHRNLAPVAAQEWLVLAGRPTYGYVDAYYATPPTQAALTQMAAGYKQLQEFNNSVRQEANLPTWPILPLQLNDISLKWGGLFPTIGWDEAAGRITGKHWQPPHYTHIDGTVVDFSLPRSAFADPAFGDSQQAYLAHRAFVRAAGQFVGRWISSATLTLRVEQNGQNGQVQASAARATVKEPDLSVNAVVLAGAPAAAAGQVVALGLSADNLLGTAPANGVKLAATLPPGLSFVAAAPSPSRQTGSTLEWDLGRLPGGSVTPIVLQVQVAGGAAVDTDLTVQVAAILAEADADAANNSIQQVLRVQPPGADLVVWSDLANLPLSTDVPVTVTLNVANFGTEPAAAVALRYTLPTTTVIRTGPMPVDAQVKTQLDFAVGDLAPGATKSYPVVIQPLAMKAQTYYTFTLAAVSSTRDIAPDSNSETLAKQAFIRSADSAVWLHVNGAADGAVRSHQPLTITLHYANFGLTAAPTGVVTLSLGSGLTFLAAAPAPTAVVSPTLVTWSLGSLPPGADGKFVVQVQAGALPPGGAAVTAAILHTGPDHLAGNNGSSKLLAVRAASPLPQQPPPPPPPPPPPSSALYLPAIQR